MLRVHPLLGEAMDTGDISRYAFYGVWILASCACLIAFSTALRLAIRGDSPLLLSATTSDIRLNWKQKIYLLAASLMLIISMYQGGRAMVSWIPDSWGSIDDEGEFQTYREIFAINFGFIAGLALIQFFNESIPRKMLLRIATYEIDWINRIYNTNSLSELNRMKHDLDEKISGLSGKLPTWSHQIPLSEQSLLLDLYERMVTLVSIG